MRLTTEEAFVKVLQAHGIRDAFGIIGSAFMPISDLFPKAGIAFWDCAHEGSGGMMADGYTRASGRMAMMIAQNGPGITNFVTAVKTAYWNHTPLLLVTPQAANRTIGQGGFQEVEQMALFRDMVAYQEEVRDPARIAEVLTRVIAQAHRLSGPAQINVPRDYWTREVDIDLPPILAFERPSGGADALDAAARLLASAKAPVILNGAGVVLAGAIPATARLAERLDGAGLRGLPAQRRLPRLAPPLRGPARLQRLQGGDGADPRGGRGAGARHAAQPLLDAAGLRDRLLAQGRAGHPGGHQPLAHRPDQGGHASASSATPGKVAEGLLARLPERGAGPRPRRRASRRRSRPGRRSSPRWTTRRTIPAPPGTQRARDAKPDWMSPRMAWRAIQAALPREAIISSDIGNNCAIGNAYPTRSRRAGSTSPPASSAPAATACPPSSAPRSRSPDVPVVGFAGDGAFGIAVTELTAIGRERVARHHHGRVPQLPVGRREAELDALVRRQLRRHRAVGPRCPTPASRRPAGSQGVEARTMDELTDGAARGGPRPDGGGPHHPDRGDDQPGAGRALPPRRDEEAGRGGGHRRGRHGPPEVLPDLGPLAWGWLAVVALGAAYVRGYSGFGFAALIVVGGLAGDASPSRWCRR